MKKIILIFLFLPFLALAQEKNKKALLFYSEDSSHCQKVEEYFQKEKIYEKYEIRKINLEGEYNLSFLNDFFDSFSISEEKRGWPAIFFGDNLLVGSRSIIENFNSQMEKYGTTEFPALLDSSTSFTKIRNNSDKNQKFLHSLLPIIISTGLTDSINPTVFAAVFLVVFILWPSCIRRKFIFAVSGFLLAILLLRFFSGVILYRDINNLSFFKSVLTVMGIISALLGILSLKYPLSGLSHAIYKIKINFFSINKASFLKGLFIGIFASLFLLPNTKEPYVAFIKFISEEFDQAVVLVALSLYNFLFIIPLLVLTLVIRLLAKKNKAREFYKKNIELIRVISGTVMVFIGIYIIRIIFN